MDVCSNASVLKNSMQLKKKDSDILSVSQNKCSEPHWEVKQGLDEGHTSVSD